MKPTNKAQAELIKEKAIELTAEELQKEFEGIFKDDLESAYLKIQAVTEAMGEDLLNTTLLQDNRLYLYEILMDNTVEEIVDDLKQIVKKG